MDPFNASLFECAGAGADCMPYHPLAAAVAAGAGAAGAAAAAAAAAKVDACALAGGARKRPCCGSVRNWINTGCYSVDSILQSRVRGGGVGERGRVRESSMRPGGERERAL